MASMPRDGTLITVGVDTHRDTHVAVALDQTGEFLGSIEAAAEGSGYRSIERFARSFGGVSAFGVEGTGCYGAGLSRFLSARGHLVVEVDRPVRATRRGCGKSDSVDAHAAALAVLSGRARASPKARDGTVEAIRALDLARRSAIRAKHQAVNQMRSLVVSAPEPVRERLRALTSPIPRGDVCVIPCTRRRDCQRRDQVLSEDPRALGQDARGRSRRAR